MKMHHPFCSPFAYRERRRADTGRGGEVGRIEKQRQCGCTGLGLVAMEPERDPAGQCLLLAWAVAPPTCRAGAALICLSSRHSPTPVPSPDLQPPPLASPDLLREYFEALSYHLPLVLPVVGS